MKTMRIISALALMMAFSMQANAQFGKLLNKAQKTITKTAKRTVEREVTRAAKDKVYRLEEEAQHKLEKTIEDQITNVKYTTINSLSDKAKKSFGNSKISKKLGGHTSLLGDKIKKDGTWVHDGSTYTHDPNNFEGFWIPDYRETFKPTPEAEEVDPQLKNNKTEEGFTKDYASIHAFYSNLSFSLFPALPYHKFQHFYWMHEKKNDSEILKSFAVWTTSVFSSSPYKPYHPTYHELKYKDGTLYATYDETFRSAWTALYMADPSSMAAFNYFAMSLIPREEFLWPRYEYKMEDEYKGLINSSKNMYLVYRHNYNLIRQNRDERAFMIARLYLKLDDVMDYVQKKYAEAFDDNNPTYGRLVSGWTAHCVYNLFLTEYYEGIQKNPRFAKIKADDSHFMTIQSALHAKMTAKAAANAPAQAAPKSVAVSAEIKNKATAAGKKYAGAQFSHIIFKSNKWDKVQENKYPYRIMGYTMPIAVVTNEEGKKLMQNCDLHKSPSGEYWISASLKGTTKVPIK